MIETILFFVHNGLLLLFGILSSVAFADVQFSKKNLIIVSVLFIICGMFQINVYLLFDEMLIWKIYPLIAHLPIALLLCSYYKKRIITALVSITTAYLCCQPSKWFGILTLTLTGSETANLIVRCFVLIITAILLLFYVAPTLSKIYTNESHKVLVFGMVPVIYYAFDYIIGIYTDLGREYHQMIFEFLPFFLCIVHLIFCVIYYREYEQKAEAKRKEQIIEIAIEQQSKEMDRIRKSNLEVRLLRHDMKFLLNQLALFIQRNDKETCLDLISDYTIKVDSNSSQTYCENEIINSVLLYYKSKCEQNSISFSASVQLDELSVDDTMFSSILSNALDNAVNAQKMLAENKREIKLMLKNSNGKLLLSVKNPFKKEPIFVDGIPVTNEKDHGYGSQSIRYMTERLGGNVQFSIEKEQFVVRVII